MLREPPAGELRSYGRAGLFAGRGSPVARWHLDGWLFVTARGIANSSSCRARVATGRCFGSGSRLLRQYQFSHVLDSSIGPRDSAIISGVSCLPQRSTHVRRRRIVRRGRTPAYRDSVSTPIIQTWATLIVRREIRPWSDGRSAGTAVDTM